MAFLLQRKHVACMQSGDPLIRATTVTLAARIRVCMHLDQAQLSYNLPDMVPPYG